MGIAHEAAGADYQKHLAQTGAAGTPAGNALMIGFMDGLSRGHKDHARIVVAALENLEGVFRKPVSIDTAREYVAQLRLAIASGSGL